jgi:hypothetical protein
MAAAATDQATRLTLPQHAISAQVTMLAVSLAPMALHRITTDLAGLSCTKGPRMGFLGRRGAAGSLLQCTPQPASVFQ